MKKVLIQSVALACCVATVMSGCALANGTTQKVSINTSVPEARIFVDGTPRGTTEEGRPVVVDLKRHSDHIVVASKEGFTSSQATINNGLSGLGVADVVGTCLFILPCISLLTGSAWELSPTSVFLPLDPKK